MSIKTTYVKPDYYDKFKCIGTKCRHNCCSYAWKIAIDKKTYKKYKSVTQPKELADAFHKYVVKSTTELPNEYATIKHLPDPIHCPFEDDKHLCMIHKELGSEYLSKTCQVYPRNIVHYIPLAIQSIFVETSMTCGCEAVVKALLDNKDMMLIDTEVAEQTQNQIIQNSPITHATHKEKDRLILKDYYLIKSISIAIIQNRELCFEDRLILLGLFSSKLHTLEQEKRENDVAHEINLFVNSLDERAFAEAFHDTKSDFNRQLLISELMFKFLKSSKEEVYGFIEDKIFENLQVKDESLTPEEKIPILVEQYKRYLNNYANYMSDKQYFIENIFTNELFRQAMPFKKGLNIYENFQYLTMMFITYRYLVAFYLGDTKQITDEELIDITAYFGRTFLNDARDGKNIINFLGKDFTNLAEMALLIK